MSNLCSRAASILLLSLALGCTPLAAEQEARAIDAGTTDAGTTDARTESGALVTVDRRDPSDLSTVIHVDERSFVVLDVEPSSDWGLGDATSIVDRPGSLGAVRSVELASLPDDVLERAGSTWRLVSLDGHACIATLDEPQLMRRAEGWAYEDETGESLPGPSTPEESELWDVALEVLVAEARAIDGDCTGAGFAHTTDHSPMRVFTPADAADPELAAEAIAAFESLPRYRAIEAEYAGYLESGADSEAAPDWRHHDGGSDSVGVGLLRAADGRELALVSASAGYGCGAFNGSAFALYEVTDVGLALRDEGVIEGAPTMVVELESGLTGYVAGERVRFLGADLGLLPESSEATLWIDSTAPFFGCPC